MYILQILLVYFVLMVFQCINYIIYSTAFPIAFAHLQLLVQGVQLSCGVIILLVLIFLSNHADNVNILLSAEFVLGILYVISFTPLLEIHPIAAFTLYSFLMRIAELVVVIFACTMLHTAFVDQQPPSPIERHIDSGSSDRTKWMLSMDNQWHVPRTRPQQERISEQYQVGADNDNVRLLYNRERGISAEDSQFMRMLDSSSSIVTHKKNEEKQEYKADLMERTLLLSPQREQSAVLSPTREQNNSLLLSPARGEQNLPSYSPMEQSVLLSPRRDPLLVLTREPRTQSRPPSPVSGRGYIPGDEMSWAGASSSDEKSNVAISRNKR